MIAYAIALLGLNILTGYNGQISLGHGAFFAIGSYVAAIMMDRWNLPYWSTLPAAGVVCFVAGFLFGLPALRLEGLYLALATFALAVATPQILKYQGIEEWTGGVQGITIIKPQAPWRLPLSPDKWLYFFALAVAIVMFVVGARLVRGRLGRALIAIRDNPTAAATMGVNTALYKTLTFGVSALFTGVGGALSAIAVQFVAPDSFGFLLSISFLVGIVIGGFATISGAIYGAFLHRIHSQRCGQHFQIRAVGGVRSVPRRLSLFHAVGHSRSAARSPAPAFSAAADSHIYLRNKAIEPR